MKLSHLAAIAAIVFFSCSKGGSTGGNSGDSGYGGTSGPSGTYLTTTSTVINGDSVRTEIYFNTDNSVQKAIILTEGVNGSVGDTTYVTIFPIYVGGKLTQLQTSADSTATSGQATTFFDYSSSGALMRIRYNPGTPAYAYDSLVIAPNDLLAQSFHFVSQGSNMVQLYSESFTWSTAKDISSLLLSNVDTSNGSVSDLSITYAYDGSFNPYKTVKDLAYILGSLDDDLPMLSANNPTSVQITGVNASNDYVYQYNSLSLPVSQNIQVLQSGSVKTSSFVFFQYVQTN
jgi:hypothetical protein